MGIENADTPENPLQRARELVELQRKHCADEQFDEAIKCLEALSLVVKDSTVAPAEAEEIERQRREESETLIAAIAVKLRLVISIEGWL
jgi:hypothetical protein